MFGGVYRGSGVFVTGHTGFKGSWLCLWLERLGAEVHGYALTPRTDPSLFVQAGVAAGITHTVGDVRDAAGLTRALRDADPHFVFHLAAQPPVLESYARPAETFATNVTGSINLMEAVRAAGIRAGYRREGALIDRLRPYLTLETLLIGSGLTVGSGLACLAWVLAASTSHQYQPMGHVLPDIMGTALLMIGAQTVLGGFLLAVFAGNVAKLLHVSDSSAADGPAALDGLREDLSDAD